MCNGPLYYEVQALLQTQVPVSNNDHLHFITYSRHLEHQAVFPLPFFFLTINNFLKRTGSLEKNYADLYRLFKLTIVHNS